MTPQNWIIEGKNRMGGRSKMTKKNRTSFMHGPLFVFYRDERQIVL